MPVLAFRGPAALAAPPVTLEVPDGWDEHVGSSVDPAGDGDLSRLLVVGGGS